MERDPEVFPEGCIGYPDEETMSRADGLAENHQYIDLRNLDIDDFHEILHDGRVASEWSERTGHSLDSDEALDHFGTVGNENQLFEWLPLDPGVASTVVALSVIGCCPITSCSGGQGHYEQHPLVVFCCDEPRLRLVEKAAEGLLGVYGVSRPGLMVYTLDSDTLLMQIFSTRLVSLWKRSGMSPKEWPPAEGLGEEPSFSRQ